MDWVVMALISRFRRQRRLLRGEDLNCDPLLRIRRTQYHREHGHIPDQICTSEALFQALKPA